MLLEPCHLLSLKSMQQVNDDSSAYLALFLLPKDTAHYLSSCSSNAALAESIWRQKLCALNADSADRRELEFMEEGAVQKSKKAYFNAYHEVRNICNVHSSHASSGL